MSRGLINKVLKRLVDQAELSKLLWSNNATGNFPAQTVSLDLSKYDYVDIAVKFLGESAWDAPANMTAVCRCKIGSRTALSIVHLNTDTAQNAENFINLATRLASVSNTGVTFTSGQMTYAGNAYANWANRCVPYRIWGIKSRGGVVTSLSSWLSRFVERRCQYDKGFDQQDTKVSCRELLHRTEDLSTATDKRNDLDYVKAVRQVLSCATRLVASQLLRLQRHVPVCTEEHVDHDAVYDVQEHRVAHNWRNESGRGAFILPDCITPGRGCAA